MPVNCWKSGTDRESTMYRQTEEEMKRKRVKFTPNRPKAGLVGKSNKREHELNENWKRKQWGHETWTDLLVCCLCVCASPSQPLSTCPMVAKASAKRSGSRPFRSTVARQPWNPSREWTSLGRSRYISLETPPIYRSPDDEQHNEWQLHEPITTPDCVSVSVRAAIDHFHYWLV